MRVPIRHRITTQLLTLAIAPALLMLVVMNGMFYAQRLSEVEFDLQSKGELLSAALAESSQYAVASGNASLLEPNLKRLLKSDISITGIRVLGAEKEVLVTVKSDTEKTRAVAFTHPIRGSQLELDLLDGSLAPHLPTADKAANRSIREIIVGHIEVDMSPDQIIASKRIALAKTTGLTLLAAALSCAFAVVFTRRLRKPMSFVISALKSIQAGVYKIEKPKIDAAGEVGVLQNTICQMADTLYETTQNLESQVTERTAALDDAMAVIRVADNEKRQLIARANHLLEDERKRIAGEIHDDLNAVFIAVKMKAQQLTYLAEKDTEISIEVKKGAAAILSATEEAYASARRLIKQLRPEIIDTLGLAAALADMVRGYNELIQDCAFELHLMDDLPKLDGAVAITAFRVVQESLVNAVKHAHASLVSVSVDLSMDNKTLLIIVNDDGLGITPSVNPVGGLGLAAMRERVEAIGGHMRVSSSRKLGTTISFVLPIS